MTPQAVINLFRSTVFDTVIPYFWSDSEVLDYLNDAQRQLCRMSYSINDGSSDDVTLCNVNAGDTWVNFHPSIMKIKTVQRLSDYKFIETLNVEDMSGGRIPTNTDSDYGFLSTLLLDGTLGELMFIVLGMSDGRGRLVRMPAVDDRLRLTVERLPLVDIDNTNIGLNSLEVRVEHHRNLIWWMGHLAYMKQDAQTFDKSKAAELEEKFLTYCEKARQEKDRREHKSRTVAYAGY